MKTELELRAKLAEMLAIDCRAESGPNEYQAVIFSKAAACKTLLWALGENEDDRWFIRAKPGPPSRQSTRNSSDFRQCR